MDEDLKHIIEKELIKYVYKDHENTGLILNVWKNSRVSSSLKS
jgi:hypothetical protein